MGQLSTSQDNASSDYRGERPVNPADYVKRFATDNLNIKIGRIVDVVAQSGVAQVNTATGTGPAYWLTGVLGGLAGTNELTTPALGSQVLVFTPADGPSIILGCLGLGTVEPPAFDVAATATNAATADYHQLAAGSPLPNGATNLPADRLPGDWGCINELGNLVALLRGAVLLKATSRSQVQLNMIDNLVRIVSGAFEHVSAQGTDTIYNANGQLSREVEIAVAQPQLSGKTAYGDATHQDYYLYEPDPKAQLLSDIKLHIGALGGLLHLFFSKPDGTGLAEVYCDNNGSLRCQSVTGLEFTKAISIPVPSRVQPYHTDAPLLPPPQPPVDYLAGGAEAQETSWLKDRHDESLVNYVPPAGTKPHWTVDDKRVPDRPATTSTIHQRADGSILLRDQANSAIELDGKGNITITCPGKLQLMSGTETVVLSGSNGTWRAKDHIDMVASKGDVRVKAEGAVEVLAKNKGVLIETQSEGVPDTEEYEAHHSSGIKLKCTKPAPILLETSGQIVDWAQSRLIHLTAGYRLECDTAVQTSRTALVVCGATWQLESTAVKLKADTISQTFTSWVAAGGSFTISGTSYGKIHGGNATDVNHRHQRSEMEYRQEIDGQHVVAIQKNNDAVNHVIAKAELMDTAAVMTPYTKDTLDRTMFTYRTANYGGKLYLNEWQNTAQQTWDWTGDVYLASAPFPGPAVEQLYRYDTKTKEFVAVPTKLVPVG